MRLIRLCRPHTPPPPLPPIPCIEPADRFRNSTMHRLPCRRKLLLIAKLRRKRLHDALRFVLSLVQRSSRRNVWTCESCACRCYGTLLQFSIVNPRSISTTDFRLNFVCFFFYNCSSDILKVFLSELILIPMSVIYCINLCNSCKCNIV